MGVERTIVLLAAVEEELRPLRRLLADSGIAAQAHFVLSGVGKANAAGEAALAVERLRPELILQVGCAGAFPASGLAPGDVVVATEDVFGDEGVETPEGFLDLRALGFALAEDGGFPVFNVIPTGRPEPGLLEEISRRAGGRFRVVAGRLLTVSTGSGTEPRAEAAAARWNPLAESMEGAAAALAALRRGCPFFEVRGISNLAGRRERQSWKIAPACENAAVVAACLLELKCSAPGNKG